MEILFNGFVERGFGYVHHNAIMANDESKSMD